MARSVSLSDSAFLALREEKRVGESDSDVILRLRREARGKRKDPAAFFAHKFEWAMSHEEYDRVLQEMDEADRTQDPWKGS